MYAAVLWLDESIVAMSDIYPLKRDEDGWYIVENGPRFDRLGWFKLSQTEEAERAASCHCMLDHPEISLFYLAKTKKEINAFKLGLAAGLKTGRLLNHERDMVAFVSQN